MKIFLVLTCCVELATFASAAQQQNDQGTPPPKKKGQTQTQTVAPYSAPGKQKFTPQHQYAPKQTFVPGQTHVNKPWKANVNAPGNASTTAKSTRFNKTTNTNKNMTVNKTFQKQHFNLQTNKVVTKYKTVNFNTNYKFVGFRGGNPRNWGPNYVVFVNYHPIWQPQWWWTSHFNHIVFIYGGWYYWNAGYWYPAWGYDPASVYYFDGPIYASSPEEDPAQVVANVQSALQQQGYYEGDIDGILGPETRAALADYQQAAGLEPTGAVDEPTLETLGLA